MARRPAGEIYLPLAVGFASDPKVRALAQFGPDAGLARDLFVQMCCHCKANLTDGFVAEYELGILVYPLDVEHGKQLAKHLAYVGLIKEVSNGLADGWQVLAYLKRNPSREEVEELSVKRAEAGRTGGQKSRRKPAQRSNQASGKQVASKLPGNQHPRDRDRGISNTELPYGSSVPDGDLNVGHVVAAYVDGAVAAGLDTPSGSLKARVGRDARTLVAEGKPIRDLIESARRMGAGEWNDLAVQYRKDNATANGAAPSQAPGRAGQWVAAGQEAQGVLEGRVIE